jgi:formylmethanofuran dehydrogenase subunit E
MKPQKNFRIDDGRVVAAKASMFTLEAVEWGKRTALVYRARPQAWTRVLAQLNAAEVQRAAEAEQARLAALARLTANDPRELERFNIFAQVKKAREVYYEECTPALIAAPSRYDIRTSTCSCCGDEFIALRANVATCSDVCRDTPKARPSRAKEKLPVDCAQCGEVFTPTRADAKFCGTRCRVAAHRA